MNCKRCESDNWKCVDERIHVYEERVTGQIYEMPVGYIVCKDCGYRWLSEEPWAADMLDVTDDFYNRG